MKTQMKNKILSPEELLKWRKKFRNLSNSARYAEAYILAKRLMALYPNEIFFAYMEAVMTAEQVVGISPKQIEARYKSATKKFRKLLNRARAMNPRQLYGLRNEYYWFSKQPYKQFQLGLKGVANGDKYAYYSQGVGAAQLAKNYAIKRRKKLSLRWAKKSEKAWLKYFQVMPNWYNSYLFYASSLGYQNRTEEMEAALAKAARIAGKSKNWKTIKHYRTDIEKIRSTLWDSDE